MSYSARVEVIAIAPIALFNMTADAEHMAQVFHVLNRVIHFGSPDVSRADGLMTKKPSPSMLV